MMDIKDVFDEITERFSDLYRRIQQLEAAVTIPVGGGVGVHTILDGGVVHTDAALDVVTRGDIIVGNATPAWDALAHPGAAGRVLVSTALDVAWSAASGITGSGTINYIPLWTAATTLGNSFLFQAGGDVISQVDVELQGTVSDSPQLRFVTNTNLDTAYFYLDEDPVPLASDLILVLPDNTGTSGFIVQDSTLTPLVSMFSDGSLTATGTITFSSLTAGYVKSSALGVLSVATTVPLTDLASYTQGDLIIGGPADWTDLAISGNNYDILGVNAAGTQPEWQTFDWDNHIITAGGDGVHDHSNNNEGGLLPAGSLTHTILNANYHTDSVTQAVTRGSLIYGNSTPKWDELNHPAAAGYALTTDATDVAWDQTPTWTGDHTWDDGAGDSPAIRLVGGSNDDLIYFFLEDDAIANRSDLAIVLADNAGQSYFYIRDSLGNNRIEIDSDGNTEVVSLGVGGGPSGINGDLVVYNDVQIVPFGAGYVKSNGLGVLSISATVPLTDLASYTQGDIIYGGAADWQDLAVGAAYTLLAVNAAGTEPSWQTFDWDNHIITAGGDGVHDHSNNNEGGTLPAASISHTVLDNSVHTDTTAQAVTRGSLIYGNATPDWDELVHPAAAGYALTTDATDVVWDQTPSWTGLHTFAAGITFNGASGANEITVPDNLAIAMELLDVGGLEYLRIVSTDAQPIIRFNNASVDIDFQVGALTKPDAFQVQGSDGQITLGALGAGFVQSTAGGVLSSAAIVAGDLPSHTHSGAGQGGSLVIGTTDTNATAGSVFFAGVAGVIQQDNANLFWDDGNNRLGIGTAAPGETLHLLSSVSGEPTALIENTNADASAPRINFYKNSASPADGDDLGLINFYGETSTGAQERYAYILGESLDVTNGDTGGTLRFRVVMNSTERNILELSGYNGAVNQGEIIFNEEGQDVDLRAEASGVTNALFLEGSSGTLYLNETSNANMAGPGITVDQGAATDEIQNWRSSNVAAVFAGVETSTFGRVKKTEGNSGGLQIDGFKDPDGVNNSALLLRGLISENTSTTKSTAGHAIIELRGFQTDGTNLVNTVANGNIVAIRTQIGGADSTTWLVDEDGDTWQDGNVLLESGQYIGNASATRCIFDNANSVIIEHLNDVAGLDEWQVEDQISTTVFRITSDGDAFLVDGAFIGVQAGVGWTYDNAGTELEVAGGAHILLGVNDHLRFGNSSAIFYGNNNIIGESIDIIGLYVDTNNSGAAGDDLFQVWEGDTLGGGTATQILGLEKDGDMLLYQGRISTAFGDFWDLEDYHAGAPTADGYVRVDINGTTYELLANVA